MNQPYDRGNRGGQQQRHPNAPREQQGGGGKTAVLVTVPQSASAMGITQEVWTTLKNSIFPGAADDSIIAAFSYCKSRGLDVLKKPCHIVPMQVEDRISGLRSWRDIIMPGISELRTTAQRTKEYMGHSEPEYGPDIVVPVDLRVPEGGVTLTVPAWCKIVVRRYFPATGGTVEFPHKEYFSECVVRNGDGVINRMWKQRPIGQLTKCTIAGALRDSFPEEIGSQNAMEEMVGRVIDGAAELVDETRALPNGVQDADAAGIMSAIRTVERPGVETRVTSAPAPRHAPKHVAPPPEDPDEDAAPKGAEEGEEATMLAKILAASSVEECDYWRSRAYELFSEPDPRLTVLVNAIASRVAKLGASG